MKSILYVGATLMVGASIYGFVDYKNTSHKKEFNNMYEDTKAVVLEKTVTDIPAIQTVTKTEPSSKVKTSVVAKKEDVTITTTKHSNNDMPITSKDVKVIEKPVVEVSVSDNGNVAKTVVKKKRKISTKIFSRAPIREYDEEEITELPVAKKTNDKEQ